MLELKIIKLGNGGIKCLFVKNSIAFWEFQFGNSTRQTLYRVPLLKDELWFLLLCSIFNLNYGIYILS